MAVSGRVVESEAGRRGHPCLGEMAFCQMKVSVSVSVFLSWVRFLIELMVIITASGNYVTVDDETRPGLACLAALPERQQFSTYQLVHCMDGGPMPLAATPPSPPASRAGHIGRGATRGKDAF